MANFVKSERWLFFKNFRSSPIAFCPLKLRKSERWLDLLKTYEVFPGTGRERLRKLELLIFKFPANKSLHCFILCQTQFIISFCRIAVAVFGSLPKFPGIITWENGPVFLTLVFEDGIFLTL